MFPHIRHYPEQVIEIPEEEYGYVIVTPENNIYIDGSDFDSSKLLYNEKDFTIFHLRYLNGYIFLITQDKNSQFQKLWIFTSPYEVFKIGRVVHYEYLSGDEILVYKVNFTAKSGWAAYKLVAIKFKITELLDYYTVSHFTWDFKKNTIIKTMGDKIPVEYEVGDFTYITRAYRYGALLFGMPVIMSLLHPVIYFFIYCLSISEPARLYGKLNIAFNFITTKWLSVISNKVYHIPGDLSLCGKFVTTLPNPYLGISLDVLAPEKTLQYERVNSSFKRVLINYKYQGIENIFPPFYQTTYTLYGNKYFINLSMKDDTWKIYEIEERESDEKSDELVGNNSKDYYINLNLKLIPKTINIISEIVTKGINLIDDGKGNLISQNPQRKDSGKVIYDTGEITINLEDILTPSEKLIISYKHYEGIIKDFYNLNLNKCLVENFIEQDRFIFIQFFDLSNNEWNNILHKKYEINTYVRDLKELGENYNKAFSEILYQTDKEIRTRNIYILDTLTKEIIYNFTIDSKAFRTGFFIKKIEEIDKRWTRNDIQSLLATYNIDSIYAIDVIFNQSRTKIIELYICKYFTLDKMHTICFWKYKDKNSLNFLIDNILDHPFIKYEPYPKEIKMFSVEEEEYRYHPSNWDI